MKKILFLFGLLFLVGCNSLSTGSQVIDMNPDNLILAEKDLPSGCNFYLGSKNRVENSVILSEWPVGEGQNYIDKTGRIDGWSVRYFCEKQSENLPNEVDDSVVIFSSNGGARRMIQEFVDYREEEGYREVASHPEIGDQSRVWSMYDVSNTIVTYIVDFSYRNIAHTIRIRGWDTEITMDTALAIARELLSKLEALPTSDEVLFTP